MHKLKGPQILVRTLKYVDEDIAIIFIRPDGGYLGKTLNLAEKIGVRRRVYYLGYVDEKTKIEALGHSPCPPIISRLCRGISNGYL
jgi:glycosyltransferase involved in cell wall biosynthesis